jgi:phage baseplate assembly protein W
MAFNVRQISPLDFQPSVGIGIALPLNNPGVFRTTYTTKDTIKADLINYFLTNQGERCLNPTFGSTLQNRLFEAITEGNIGILEDIISLDLATYFPQVIVEKITTSPQEDYNTLTVSIEYSVRNTNINDTLEFNFA